MNYKIKQAKSHSEKHGIEQSSNMNRNSLWSRSRCSEHITNYMDGISIQNFDRKNEYTAVLSKKNEWLIFHKKSLCSKETPLMTKFDRVRTVKYENDYITCNCGMIHKYLAPCVHVMKVLDDEKYLTADLFHI